MKSQTMLIIPFSLICIVYRTRPDKIVSCAGVKSKINFVNLLSVKVWNNCKISLQLLM